MSLSFDIGNILNDKEIDRDDYFGILGCSENATIEQISTEYRIRALKFHPDKNPGNEKALHEFQKLQEARDILTDPEMRRLFDKWRHSQMAMRFKTWLNMHSRVATTMHWAKPSVQTMLESSSTLHQSEPSRSSDTEPLSRDWDHVKRSSRDAWESDASSNVYCEFRNYKI